MHLTDVALKRETTGLGIDYTAFGSSVAACFERATSRHPHRTAICCRLGEISYAELNAGANSLAHLLLESGGNVGERVAILMPQDRRIFLAIIATLKTGRIVLVLNGGDPPSRIRQLLDDAEPTIILTVDSHWEQAQELAGSKMGVISVDTLLPETAESPKIEIGPDDIAFLVYTSGSTGQPKGVMKTHGSILRNALDVSGAAGVVPEDRILLAASLWGGLALNTTWFTLVNGATLMSFPVVENGFTGLAEWLTKQRVSIFVSASSLFRHFMKSIDTGTRFPDIRLVKLSADPATREDFEKVLAHFPNSILMHSISLTETGNLAYMMLTRNAVIAEGHLPVGRPFDSIDLRILDEEGRDCPPGTIGTISAGLRYLAAGYWRDPIMTAKHFFEGPRGTRAYRGGDLAFVNDEGFIVFVGRKDATYKIRGQLVDLTEVERGLSGIPGVRDVAVVGAPRPNGESSLVAYVVSSPGLTSRRLRSAARAHMAGHLVPSFFVFIEALPRSANGKVDRTQLRENVRPLLRDATSSLPTTETEALMVRIWAEAAWRSTVNKELQLDELSKEVQARAEIQAKLETELSKEVQARAEIQAKLETELRREVQARAEMQAELERVLNSKSWRVTKPLRKASTVVRDRLGFAGLAYRRDPSGHP